LTVLEAELVQLATKPPAGTEDLAQGEETIVLHFRFAHGNAADEAVESFTWNELISLLGPHLLCRATEEDLKRALNQSCANRIIDSTGLDPLRTYIRDEDFQKVKIQLRALGLIERDPSKDGQWVLTPYGDGVMTRIAAIRSKTANTGLNAVAESR
jgi:hypothetical protein